MKNSILSATAVYFFTVSALIFSGCNKKETSGPAEPALGPVERLHMDDLSVQSIKFHNGRTADYKILLDKPEMSVVLFSLKKGDEIPAHIHSADKAVHIYGGKADIFAQNKMKFRNERGYGVCSERERDFCQEYK